mmetsp:Transcript_38880/g.82061  ORF Transcript_38880/g.82061 Transcript_38880/m.82061 type:complete len:609 (+) Transcript_38880:32-1858(+)
MGGDQKVHGTEGVWCAGKWIDIEDCGDWQTCGGDCAKAPEGPRQEPEEWDVVVIGAGCVGSAIARELSRYNLKVALLESADDVTQGATKGNSGIVHAGYDDKPGSVRAEHCWKGNQMFAQLDRELKFGYWKNGSMVLAFTGEEERILDTLLLRGKDNGVTGLKILEREEILKMEPNVNPKVTKALYAPEAGTVAPYEFAIALAENAIDNGVFLKLYHKVVAVSKRGNEAGPDHLVVTAIDALSGTPKWVMICKWVAFFCMVMLGIIGFIFFKPAHVSEATPFFAFLVCAATQLKSAAPEVSFKTKFVINAAGNAADAVAQMVNDTSFAVRPRHGEYILLHKNQGHLVNATIFPCPDPHLGKGVLVQGTIWGNLILGPTARDVHDPDERLSTKDSVARHILSNCKKLVPGFDAKEVIHSFSGARAKTDRGDWIIEESVEADGFLHAAGIDSPGLAGSPSIALKIVDMLKERGLELEKNPNFNPNRRPIIVPKSGWKGLKVGAEGEPEKNVVCKCEKVTEAEVIDACHRSIPIDNTQGIRKRTRAGMGHCQGDPENLKPSCEQRVAAIIARERKIPIAKVGRRTWPASSILPARWMDDKQKAVYGKMAGS